MATIRTAIELQDNFTSVLYKVIDSVNLGLSAMEDFRRGINAQVDTSSIDAARDSINQATIAAQQLDAAMQSVEAPAISMPAAAASTAGVSIPTAQPVQQQIFNGSPVEIPVTWKTDSLEAFTSTGIERFEQEIQSANNMLNTLNATQERITQTAAQSNILSPQAQTDIEAVTNRIQALQQSIESVEQNPLTVGADSANASIEQLRARLTQTIELQNNLNAAMQGADISQINDAYLKLSQNISGAERMMRDSFANVPSVEIPITWKTDNLEVFTSTGIDRFEQEIQSANNMLNTLNATQARIVNTAAQTNLFPANAVASMNNVQTRLQAIALRIQQIENNPLNIGTGTANAELERLRGQLSQAIAAQENLNRAVADMDVQAANAEYLRLSQTIGNTESYIRDNVDEQGRFNQAINEGAANADSLMSTIKNAVAAYATMQTVGEIINLSDEMTQTTARLNLIVDDGGSVDELQQKIFASAQQSRGDYQATADAVAKLGLSAGNAFSGTDEIIAFAEQLNKQFTIAGTPAQGISAAMLQLTQAMGAGTLRGEEYNSMLDNASGIINNIAGYIEGNESVLNSVAAQMGMTADELAGNVQNNMKDIASEGLISSEMVKNAMFYAAEETNAAFDSMPMTFAQIWTSFKNNALMAFQPVLQRINDIANSAEFQTFVANATNAVSYIAGVVVEVFNLLVDAAGFVCDNWSLIAPILLGVAAAIAVCCGAIKLHNAVTSLSTAITIANTLSKQAHKAALMMQAGATFKVTVAQYGLNAALLACPLTVIIGSIIAVITVIYIAVAAINKFAGTTISATGVICAAFAVAYAFIYNRFVVPFQNGFARLANFFGNVFDNPIAAVKVAFYDMCITVIGYISNLANTIETLLNKIPGVTVDITSGLDNFYAGLEQARQTVKDESGWVEYVAAWDYVDYADAATKGYNFGERIGDKISAVFSASTETPEISIPEYSAVYDVADYGAADVADDVGSIAGNTGSIADSLDVTEEELKYLRDIAEQEIVNRFTTAEITIEQTNHNNVSSSMDLDGIVIGLTDAVNEAVGIIAEGVHA